MSTTVQVPTELCREFRQFREDYEAVWLRWIETGEEPEGDFARAKAEAMAWIGATATGPDGAAKLQAMFAYWSDLRHRVAPLQPAEVAVVPLMAEVDVKRLRAERQQGVR